MSALLMGRVFYTDLPANLKLTLLALADVADDDGSRVFLGQKRIARKVGCSERSIRTHLGELRKLGYLTKLTRDGSHGQDRHGIVVDKLPSHEQIALMFPRAAKVADRQPAATRQDSDVSTGSTASVERQVVADDSSATHPSTQDHRSPTAVMDYFDSGKWAHLLEKLYLGGWTEKGQGALTWPFLMKLRERYGSAIVDSALSDATYNDKAPAMSSAAYFESICVRIQAERSAA